MDEEPRFGVRILCCQYATLPHWNWDHLAAPYWRFYWNRSHNGVIRCQDRDVPMSANSMFLIAPDTDYDSRSDDPIEQLYIHFVADRPFDSPPTGVLSLPSERVPSALLRLLTDGDATGSVTPVQMAARCALCCWALTHVPESWTRLGCPDDMIARAQDYMLGNLGRRMTNAEIAGHVNLSVRTFLRRFREATGESCQDWFRRRRIQQACLLLHTTGSSIDRIATDCGFCDRHHFSRVFAELRGTPPAAFRRITVHLNRAFAEESDAHREEDVVGRQIGDPDGGEFEVQIAE